MGAHFVKSGYPSVRQQEPEPDPVRAIAERIQKAHDDGQPEDVQRLSEELRTLRAQRLAKFPGEEDQNSKRL